MKPLVYVFNPDTGRFEALSEADSEELVAVIDDVNDDYVAQLKKETQ